ncbi:MAG: type II toxin-antitoxin system VapC family toxin [Pirellulales bacterium]|nr:type II toxin-antitoxin system VapC family toxin [Pirellulales bacterium]
MKGLLDSNAILYLLGGRLAVPLESGQYFISVISELELLSYPSMEEAEERQIRAFLSKVIVLGLTKNVRENAIRLRKEYRLKLPDAIVAASALSLNVTLLTNDKTLLKIPGVSAKSLHLK